MTSAIVVFERDLASEAREKRLQPRFLARLRHRIEAQAHAVSGADAWIATARGDKFELSCGSRLLSFSAATLQVQMEIATRAMREAGYQQVLFVASDVALSTSTLSTALGTLRADPAAVVVGKNRDGGFYLFGYTAPLPFQWSAIPLFNSNAAATLQSISSANFRTVSEAPVVRDLDAPEVLPHFALELRSRGLFRLLRDVAVSVPSHPRDGSIRVPSFFVTPARVLRGPPLA